MKQTGGSQGETSSVKARQPILPRRPGPLQISVAKESQSFGLGEPAAILLHSQLRSAWIGMLRNRIHVGQLFFFGSRPGSLTPGKT